MEPAKDESRRYSILRDMRYANAREEENRPPPNSTVGVYKQDLKHLVSLKAELKKYALSLHAPSAASEITNPPRSLGLREPLLAHVACDMPCCALCEQRARLPHDRAGFAESSAAADASEPALCGAFEATASSAACRAVLLYPHLVQKPRLR